MCSHCSSISLQDLNNSIFNKTILDVVQRRRIFKDSKHFVDMVLKKPLADIKLEFKNLNFTILSKHSDIQQFVQLHYLEPKSDADDFTPPDWRVDGVDDLAGKIEDAEVRDFIQFIHSQWVRLCVKPKSFVFKSPRLSSLVFPPCVEGLWYVVPGGRFSELFYWDSFWVLKGLAVSGMHETMKSMLKIFFAFVEWLGYIPNCSRVYCLNRSQPPLLALMMDCYLQTTNDWSFLKDNFHLLVQELKFWYGHRAVTVSVDDENFELSRYGARSCTHPRPEGYAEDFATAADISREEAHSFYKNIVATCESGWDFSSRWLEDSNDLKSVKTTDIVPVDLNAFLYKAEVIVAEFAKRLNRLSDAQEFSYRASKRLRAFKKVFWSDEIGCWFDFDLTKQALTKRFYLSNLIPLFANAVEDVENVLPKVLKYLTDSSCCIFDFPGGFPASSVLSEQQWDFPNVWPPLMHMVLEGFFQHSQTRELAEKVAWKWLRSVLVVWKRDGVVYEKMDCREAGVTGSGGEYVTQFGFGWTNGALLDILSNRLFNTSKQ